MMKKNPLLVVLFAMLLYGCDQSGVSYPDYDDEVLAEYTAVEDLDGTTVYVDADATEFMLCMSSDHKYTFKLIYNKGLANETEYPLVVVSEDEETDDDTASKVEDDAVVDDTTADDGSTELVELWCTIEDTQVFNYSQIELMLSENPFNTERNNITAVLTPYLENEYEFSEDDDYSFIGLPTIEFTIAQHGGETSIHSETESLVFGLGGGELPVTVITNATCWCVSFDDGTDAAAPADWLSSDKSEDLAGNQTVLVKAEPNTTGELQDGRMVVTAYGANDEELDHLYITIKQSDVLEAPANVYIEEGYELFRINWDAATGASSYILTAVSEDGSHTITKEISSANSYCDLDRLDYEGHVGKYSYTLKSVSGASSSDDCEAITRHNLFGENSGDGSSPATAFEIANPRHLSNLVVGGLDKYYRQVATVELASDNLLASYGDFAGEYDGGDFSIVNTGAPLFNSIVASTGRVSNLTISNPVIAVEANVGAFAVTCAGVIENCIVEGGSIKASTGTGSKANNANFGGFVATVDNSGLIKSCINKTPIDGGCNVGGIAGVNNGTIENCRNEAVLVARFRNAWLGGIAGYNGKVAGDVPAMIIASCNTVDLTPYKTTADRSNYYGGIASLMANGSQIVACYNLGAINGYTVGTANTAEGLAGGIVGRIEDAASSVVACYNSGVISGMNPAGIANINKDITPTVSDCYTTALPYSENITVSEQSISIDALNGNVDAMNAAISALSIGYKFVEGASLSSDLPTLQSVE